jgi:hypothetical protein
MTASQPSLEVTVKGRHGQGMEWAWIFWLPNLLGDFGTSASMHSGIAPLVHAPRCGVTGQLLPNGNYLRRSPGAWP